MPSSSRRGFLSLMGLMPAARAAAQTFTDVAQQAGLGRAKNVSGAPLNKQWILEEMGCGVALFDYDNDGWLDIFLVNATAPGATKPTSYLFRNNRDGTFTDVSRKAGLNVSGWGQACCVGDFDNDGFDDLFVSYWGRNVLYRNNGDGTFTDVSGKAGVGGTPGRWGAGCCFLDYNRDGLLDIFVAHYLNFDLKTAPKPGQSGYCLYNDIPVPCGPQGFSGGTNVLYRNRGDGTFEDVSEKSGIVNPRGLPGAKFVGQHWRPVGSYGMGAVVADFDNDGWPDIYVSCDTAPSLLYRNNHDGTFSEIGVPAGAAFDENGVAMSGMGTAAGDYNNDGYMDLARTNFSEQVTTVYRNNGDGTFLDASLGAGMGVNRKWLGFGVGFVDYDNDGWRDLMLANGHVYAQLHGRNLFLSYEQPRVLYRNMGNGKFTDVSAKAGAGIAARNVGRGMAFGDLDNDGDVDVVINNLDRAPSLLRNSGGSGNNWLIVKCVGTKSNRSAVGARVRVTAGGRTLTDEVMSGGSYYSHSDLRLHFGMAKAEKADLLEVAWPSGARDSFENIGVNRVVTITEGQGLK